MLSLNFEDRWWFCKQFGSRWDSTEHKDYRINNFLDGNKSFFSYFWKNKKKKRASRRHIQN